jgi:hypothetical protein
VPDVRKVITDKDKLKVAVMLLYYGPGKEQN